MMQFRLILLLSISLYIEVAAFTPNPFLPSQSSNVVNNGKSSRTFASVATSEVHEQVNTRKRSHFRRQNPKGGKFNEFQWLNWVYCQWRSTKPGELDKDVLKQMVPAISSWGRRKTIESAGKAEELLERIVEENLAGNASAELTVTLFNSAMDAYSKVGNPDGVQRILQRMHQLRQENTHLVHLQPDVFSMSTLATAWAKSRSPEAAKKAEAILNYMAVRKMPPNTITYNAVLNALAYGKEVDKALRIEDILKRMQDRSEAGEDCEPDIYSYQSLIQALSKTPLSGSPQKAEQILLFLDEESENGKKHLKPNSYCFTCKSGFCVRSFQSFRRMLISISCVFIQLQRRYTHGQNQKRNKKHEGRIKFSIV
jgi:hypothetical protein